MSSNVQITATQSSRPLSEFNPLVSLSIPGVGEIKPGGLVVIVGPNSSGKTQLLQDIHLRLVGQPRPFVVCQTVQLRKPPDFRDFLATLIEEGYVRERVEPNGEKVLQTRTAHFGTGQAVTDKIRYIDAEQAYTRASLDQPGTQPHADLRFLAHFGRMLSTVLFLANRLTAANSSQHFDYENAHPNNDVQALYMNWAARDELTAEIRRVFRRGIWLDNTRGGQLCFRVSEMPDIPPAEDRLRPDKVTQYRMIESEGDGFRSYVATCMALLMSRRPICLLDEPELCLHPPQAYAIGQFIGRHATTNKSTTFAATHSSHVLRGVIEATDQLKIIRMTRTSGQFYGHLVDYGILKECIQKPIVRTETIFDGIFADAVTIVEADGDRAVYEAARESMPKDSNLDVLFIPVGGTGGIADTAALYRALRIPVAVVADLDLIMDQGKLREVLIVLCGLSFAAKISEECRIVAAKIKEIPPTVPEGEVKAQFTEWAQSSCEWSKNEDQPLMSQLRRLANRIDRMRRLKAGGIGSFDAYSDIQTSLTQIINECREVGLFLVPVGELEYWARDVMAGGPSKTKKSEWANEAARRIRAARDYHADIFQFMQEIERFHNDEIKRLAIGTIESGENSSELAVSVETQQMPAEATPNKEDFLIHEALTEDFEKLNGIIGALPPQVRVKTEAIVKDITGMLGNLGDATEVDVWDGKTFSSTNGIGLMGTLSVAPAQLIVGQKVHDVVGTYYPRTS
jgi:energy-coupling factor transporter ATP-binding protein EcfA2